MWKEAILVSTKYEVPRIIALVFYLRFKIGWFSSKLFDIRKTSTKKNYRLGAEICDLVPLNVITLGHWDLNTLDPSIQEVILNYLSKRNTALSGLEVEIFIR